MKLLILTTCNYEKLMSLEDCQTRAELFIFQINSYIKTNDKIELVIRKCYPNHKIKYGIANIIKYPESDHTIFINDTGFPSKNNTFIKHLKNTTKYSVSSWCNSSKYYNNEDLLISYDSHYIFKNQLTILVPCDQYIYCPRKQKDNIYILFTKHDNNIPKRFLNEFNMMISKIKILIENNPIFTFILGKINVKEIEFFDIELNTIEIKKFNMYTEYIYELSKANFLFLFYSINDIILMHEAAMCNTLIVSKNIFIAPNIQKDLDIFTYSNELEMPLLFDKLMSYDIRNKLINNGYLWENVIETIRLKLKTFENDDLKNKIIHQKNIIQKKKIILNIKNKNSPYFIKQIKQNNINQENIHKLKTKNNKHVVLQSKLRLRPKN